MKNNDIKYEYVKSMKLAGILMQKGFRILAIKKDKYNPVFDVYCFRQTRELTNEILNFIENENGGKENGINNKKSKDISTR
jgi:hypothetical protein